MGQRRHIQLSEAARRTLNEGYQNGASHHFRQKCQALLWNADGWHVSTIATLMKRRENTILHWLNLWEQHGIARLHIATGRGRKAVLDTVEAGVAEAIKKK